MIDLIGAIEFERNSISFTQSLGLTPLTGSAIGYSYDPYAVETGATLQLTDGASSVSVVVREVEAIRTGDKFEIHVRFSDRMDEIMRLPVVYDEFDNINGRSWSDILAAVQADIPYGWNITSDGQAS